MNELVLPEEDFKQMNEVASLVAKGENNFTRIAKQMGIKRAAAINLYEQWKTVATNDEVVRERAKAVVAEADEHYSHILREYWSLIDEADNSGVDGLKIKNSALKNVADVTAKRIEFLSRAGLMEDAALGDQIADAEDKLQQMKELMKQVAKDNPAARQQILEGLGRIFDTAEPVVVESRVVDPGA